MPLPSTGSWVRKFARAGLNSGCHCSKLPTRWASLTSRHTNTKKALTASPLVGYNSIAEALEVDVGYFFEGLNQLAAPKLSPQQRMLLELAQSFLALPTRRQQAALCELARAIVKGDMAGERGSPVNAALA